MASVIPQTAAPSTALRVFTPDSLLPDQIGWVPVATPEQRLLIAVMEEAVGLLALHARVATEPKLAKPYADTVAWFLSDDESGAFTFRGMCAHLGSGWEPDCVLAALRAQGLLR